MSVIKELTAEKMEIAEAARVAACEIVQDAIEKKFYGFPVSFFYSCLEPIDGHTFCCIPSEKFLCNLAKKLKEISFKEDTGEPGTYAYVEPSTETNIVFLCEEFWADSCRDTLCRDSKIGTLIHEVSHLLGTEDISYDLLTVEVWEGYNTLLGKSKWIKKQDSDELNVTGDYRLEHVVQYNANSLEYEFETIINHEKEYLNGNYECCGETKKNSVCVNRSTGHYSLYKHFSQNKERIEQTINKLKEEIASANPVNGKIKYIKTKDKVCTVVHED